MAELDRHNGNQLVDILQLRCTLESAIDKQSISIGHLVLHELCIVQKQVIMGCGISD